MSFDKSMFPVGFNQKSPKEDLFVKGNHVILQDKQHGKTLEDYRRYSTKAGLEPLIGGAGRPHYQAGWPMGPTWRSLFAMSVLHHLKDCISTVYSSQFDPRAQK